VQSQDHLCRILSCSNTSAPQPLDGTSAWVSSGTSSVEYIIAMHETAIFHLNINHSASDPSILKQPKAGAAASSQTPRRPPPWSCAWASSHAPNARAGRSSPQRDRRGGRASKGATTTQTRRPALRAIWPRRGQAGIPGLPASRCCPVRWLRAPTLRRRASARSCALVLVGASRAGRRGALGGGRAGACRC
jgi:hypothetical protein